MFDAAGRLSLVVSKIRRLIQEVLLECRPEGYKGF